MTEIIRLNKETERRIKKLIERQKHEILEDELSRRTKDIHPHVFYDYPLKPLQKHSSSSIQSYWKSSPDIRSSKQSYWKSSPDIRSSKRSASVQTCPIRECIKKYYPSDFSTNPRICHDSIILPSNYYQSLCNNRRSVSASNLTASNLTASNLRRTPTCDKSVQVKRSMTDPSRSMTNLPKEKLTEKLILAAAERRSVAMKRESFDVTSCRNQHPAFYDKEEVRHFMKMRQVMSKRVDDVRSFTARKRPVDTITPTLQRSLTRPADTITPTLQRSLTKTVIRTSDMSSDLKKEETGKEFIVNRAEILSHSKSHINQKNISRHRLSAKELKEMLDEILLQNVVKNCSIKLPKINNLIGKPILGVEEESLGVEENEVPSLLKPKNEKNVLSFDTINDSWLPDTHCDISSIQSGKEGTIEDTSISDRSQMPDSFKRSYPCKYESSRHEKSPLETSFGEKPLLEKSFGEKPLLETSFGETSFGERDRKEDTSVDRKEDTSVDRRQSIRSEFSKLSLENSSHQIIEDESSFSQLPKVSFDDVFSNILERHRKGRSVTDPIDDHLTRSNASSSNSDNTLQVTNKSNESVHESNESVHESNESVHESSESPLSSLSDDSSSTCSGKSYSVTTEPTSSQSQQESQKESQQESSKEEESLSNSLLNDLSITERINLIYSQRNISPSSSVTDLKDEKSISSNRENHIKCLRITPEIYLDENNSEPPAGSDEVLKNGKKNERKNLTDEKGNEKPIKESEPTFVDEEKYEVSEEIVTRMVREICELVVQDDQVQPPDDWKWSVSQKYNNHHSPVQDSDHINQSMHWYRRFLCDLIESTMKEVFRNGRDQDGFKSASIKSIAKFARKRPLPTSSMELFQAIHPIILKTVGIRRQSKPSFSRDGILGHFKNHLDRDLVDVVALNEMIDEDDDWNNYDEEINQLLDLLNDNIFYTLLDSLAKEVFDDILSPT